MSSKMVYLHDKYLQRMRFILKRPSIVFLLCTLCDQIPFILIGVDEEMRSKAKEGLIQPVQEINIKGDEYSIKTTVGHLSTEVCFKLGVTFPSSSMDGKKIMVIFRNVPRESVSKVFRDSFHFLYAQVKVQTFSG